MIRTIEPGDVVILEGGLRCKIERQVGIQFVGTLLGTGKVVWVQWAYYHAKLAA